MLSLSKHSQRFFIGLLLEGPTISDQDLLQIQSGRFPLAKRETSSQSPRIMASFSLRFQPLIRRSETNASSRVENSSEKRNGPSLSLLAVLQLGQSCLSGSDWGQFRLIRESHAPSVQGKARQNGRRGGVELIAHFRDNAHHLPLIEQRPARVAFVDCSGK